MIFAALASGRSTIEGYSTGADCASTLHCLRALGIPVTVLGQDEAGLRLRIDGRGPRGFLAPADTLDAGNSGTTMRLLAGRMKQVVEPTGCLAAAAAMFGVAPVQGKRVGVIISGGNVDLANFARFVA